MTDYQLFQSALIAEWNELLISKDNYSTDRETTWQEVREQWIKIKNKHMLEYTKNIDNAD